MAIKYITFPSGGVFKADHLNSTIMPSLVVQCDLVSDLSSVASAVKCAYVVANASLYVRGTGGTWQRQQTRQVLAQLRQGAAQSIGAGITNWNNIMLDVEDIDTDNGHVTSGATDTWTAPIGGTYRVSGKVVWAAQSGTSVGARGARIAKNNNQIVAGTSTITNPLQGVATVVVTGAWLIGLNAGDFISLQGMQDSGGALSTWIGTSGDNSILTAELVQAY